MATPVENVISSSCPPSDSQGIQRRNLKKNLNERMGYFFPLADYYLGPEVWLGMRRWGEDANIHTRLRERQNFYFCTEAEKGCLWVSHPKWTSQIKYSYFGIIYYRKQKRNADWFMTATCAHRTMPYLIPLHYYHVNWLPYMGGECFAIIIMNFAYFWSFVQTVLNHCLSWISYHLPGF